MEAGSTFGQNAYFSYALDSVFKHSCFLFDAALSPRGSCVEFIRKRKEGNSIRHLFDLNKRNILKDFECIK